MTGSADSLRIDRWLYFCRFFKTRGKASDAVTGGHVKLNGERVNAGTKVKPGDTVDLVRDRLHFRFDVTAIPARRGPAAEAQACYVEDEDTVRQRNEQATALKQDRYLLPRTHGRPDKHTRRKLRERKGQ